MRGRSLYIVCNCFFASEYWLIFDQASLFVKNFKLISVVNAIIILKLNRSRFVYTSISKSTFASHIQFVYILINAAQANSSSTSEFEVYEIQLWMKICNFMKHSVSLTVRSSVIKSVYCALLECEIKW